jgi:hypothetical protein
MKLYEVPRNTNIRILEETQVPIGSKKPPTELMFHHVDGMYSLCSDENGNIVHIAAWTEVERVDEMEK